MTVPPDPPASAYPPPGSPVPPGYPAPPGYPPPAYPGYTAYPGQPGQPGQPGYPAPPPKKSNAWWIILIIAGVLALVCCLGLVGGGYWLFRAADSAVGPARSTAVQFVEDLENGNAVAAYDLLCPQTQERWSRAEFVVSAESEPIVDHKVTGFNVNTNNGDTSATITMDLTKAGGGTLSHSFPMVKQGGTWYVCGDPY